MRFIGIQLEHDGTPEIGVQAGGPAARRRPSWRCCRSASASSPIAFRDNRRGFQRPGRRGPTWSSARTASSRRGRRIASPASPAEPAGAPVATLQGDGRTPLSMPRSGFCWPLRAAIAPGVDRAVQTVEHALDLHGAPVYVRKEIVHNKHVVQQLSERGADLRRGGDRGAGGELSSSSAPTASPRRSTPTPPRAACGRSMRPARSSPRSTSRRGSSPNRATRSS